jgi:hypothetical protein
MTQFTILHHGVPLAVASTVPQSDADDPKPFALNMMDFEPATAYELADAVGNPVAGRVMWLIDDTIGGNASYWVDVELDDASADVRARMPTPPRRASGYTHLSPNA